MASEAIVFEAAADAVVGDVAVRERQSTNGVMCHSVKDLIQKMR